MLVITKVYKGVRYYFNEVDSVWLDDKSLASSWYTFQGAEWVANKYNIRDYKIRF